MARIKLEKKSSLGGAYFASPKEKVEFISTGCELLDCVLGGGWVLGRVSNVVGDKSTGKTLLAIEACANFAHTFDHGDIRYAEAESAFDVDYAENLGLPRDRVTFVTSQREIETVEDVFEDLAAYLEKKDPDEPGLYIVDSLDALSDRAEMGTPLDKGSYGMGKAKMMSKLFRQLVRRVERSRVHVMIISQVRDNIGVTFGKKTTRSGGRALDFYATHVLYLAHMQTLKQTVNKTQRAIGVTIKAKCEKNKIALPFRDCQFDIRFGFGIDDIGANLDWLKEIGQLSLVDLTEGQVPRFMKDLETMDAKDVAEFRALIAAVVRKEWYTIERKFVPTRRKYA